MAILFVPFANVGSEVRKISIGSANNDPPAATVFMKPAQIPVPKSKTVCKRLNSILFLCYFLSFDELDDIWRYFAKPMRARATRLPKTIALPNPVITKKPPIRRIPSPNGQCQSKMKIATAGISMPSMNPIPAAAPATF